MAQTTQDASFGPVFLIATQPNPPRHFKTWMEPKYNKKCYLVLKKREDKKKTCTFGPNDVSCIVWACICHRHLLRWWVRKPSTGGASRISLLPLNDQTTRASPRPRSSSQEACQPRGTKTMAQAFKSHPTMLTGGVSAEDSQYSKEAYNIAISGDIRHQVYLLRLSVALGPT